MSKARTPQSALYDFVVRWAPLYGMEWLAESVGVSEPRIYAAVVRHCAENGVAPPRELAVLDHTEGGYRAGKFMKKKNRKTIDNRLVIGQALLEGARMGHDPNEPDNVRRNFIVLSDPSRQMMVLTIDKGRHYENMDDFWKREIVDTWNGKGFELSSDPEQQEFLDTARELGAYLASEGYVEGPTKPNPN